MPAYIISRTRVNDDDLMQQYRTKALPMVKRYGGEYVARSTAVEALDGIYDGRTLVIMKFPDAKTVRAFWNSPEYQEIRKLRLAATDSDVWLVAED